MKLKKLSTLTLAVIAILLISLIPQNSPAQSTNSAPPKKPAAAATDPAADEKSQSKLASKTAEFAKVAKTDETYKSALDAHALDAALKQVDKDGGFKGKLDRIYTPRGNAMVILNFDPEYKTALTALLRSDNFGKFPDLKTIAGKEVLVTGKFIEFQGRAEIILTKPEQIKIVEDAK